jgi:GNAT superfamily N-acetyltransferase
MTNYTIVNLSTEHIGQAASVLAQAFDGYPVMRYVFSGKTESEAQACRQKMFELSSAIRATLGWPWFGCIVDGQLAASAYVTPPASSDAVWPQSLKQLDEAFDAFIGPEALARFGEYVRVASGALPKEPHFYLNAIGVHPNFKGQGLARPLLEAVHALAENHPNAIGVALSTETKKNVPLYEHFGYEVRAHNRVSDDLQTWSMFRPKGA